MGLPARQRRRLENIEHKLRSSDPRLAAMFAIFGRLTQDEEMPRIEELRHRAAVLALRARLWLARGARRPATGSRPGRWRPMALFFPLALVLMSLSIFVAARLGGAPRCAGAPAVATAKLHPRGKPVAKGSVSKSTRRCLPTMLTPIPIGR